ncbi:restriction endonuclease, partial [Ilumatobacter sp.]|uniref:restriction endonuclease n=1 Tax=Ilumatobacter sp. TaxID=1967498 RepID=UPI0037514F2F
ASNTRKLLRNGKKVDPFEETSDQIVSRVLRQFGGKGKLNEIVVLNDEAHHCYQNKPLDGGETAAKEDESRNEDARVWFRGLRAVARKIGIKTVYDLSATPYYLSGSGYNEGFIFPWTVSDFSLMDAIECGVVKVPRMPVDDDATTPEIAYLHLWDFVGTELPKRAGKKAGGDSDWVPPETLEGALFSLYRSYAARFDRWQETLAPLGEPPPVLIVVCPNTIVSKLVYDWIAGADVETPDGRTVPKPGKLDLLSNVVEGVWIKKPRTVLIDSAQLESGEAIKDDFKKAAAHEIEAFKSEIRVRTPGADTDSITDEDLLREVMNTVGKKGKLGEQVRCVVSVSMLTEGWDANTVTHILGIRAFGSQLLCEQVIGRGLRRRDYTVNDEGRFEPEFAEVYGVPFKFIPTEANVLPDPKPKPPPIEVKSVAERGDLRISFPRLTGYRIELPPDILMGDFEDPSAHLHVNKTEFATWTTVSGVVGPPDQHEVSDRPARLQEVAYDLAAQVLRNGRLGLGLDQDGKTTVPFHTRFPQLVQLASEWLENCVKYEPGCELWVVARIAEWRHRAAERLENSIVLVHRDDVERAGVLLPILDRFAPVGDTDEVSFFTRKVVVDAVKSPINRVTLDGIKGNTWEETVAGLLERHSDVWSYVKNDGLDFMVPYVHAGVAYEYKPDFIVKLSSRSEAEEVDRFLIIEVSGTFKDQVKRQVKAETTREKWCGAVNRHGGHGQWDFLEIDDMAHAESNLNGAIKRMYLTDFERAMTD